MNQNNQKQRRRFSGFNSKRLWGTLILMLVVTLSQVSVVSSFEFDDVKNYDEKKLEYSLTNAFGLGEQIATIKLNTPEIYEVGLGYQKVAEIEITNGESDYSNILKQMQFYNIREGMQEFEREFDYKYLTTKEIDVPLSCDMNFTNDCGTRKEQVEEWLPFTKNSLLKNEVITIGIFTNVEEGDYVEWIPTVYGNERLTKWAVWTANLDVGLVSYWNLDETSGTLAGDELGINNGTATNTNIFSGAVAGIIGTAASFDGTETIDMTTLSSTLEPDVFTISAWVYTPLSGAVETVVAKDRGESSPAYQLLKTASNKMNLKITLNTGTESITGSTTLSANTWTHVVAIFNGTNTILYVNGSEDATPGAGSGTIDYVGTGGSAHEFHMGTWQPEGGKLEKWTGRIDEVGFWNRTLNEAEIAQLYNNDSGLTKDPSPVINILFPEAINYNQFVSDLNYSVEISGGSLDACWNSIDGGLTNSSSVSAGTNFTGVSSSEGSNTWAVYCNSTVGVEGSDSVTFNVDTVSPIINFTQPIVPIDYHALNTNLTFNWTATDTNLDACWYVYGALNNTVTCGDNNASINITTRDDRSLRFYANDTAGLESESNLTWTYKIFENSRTLNTTAFETSIEHFIINVTANASLTSGQFVYDGADISTTQNGEIFTSSIVLDSVGAKELLWDFTYNSEVISSPNSTQTVSPITFALCNATLTTPYINLTFKNETISEEDISATISSTWTYWLGDGSLSKTLTFSNSSENMNYSFCFSPDDKSLNINYTINYNNAVSQQRTAKATALFTNITTLTTLYLLPNSLGLFSPFQTVSSVGDAIEGVLATITRTIGGSPITVTTTATDSSGFLTIFLNPDVTYSAVFSKVGFPDNAFSFVPTTTTRTVTMGGGAGTIDQLGNGTIIAQNTSYIILPSNSSLNNNTDYTFSFAVSSSQSISLISMNITNSTGGQLLFQSNSGTGTVSSVLNTGNNTKLIGTYILQTSSETFSFTKIWIIGSEFEGSYSIFTQLTLFMDYNFTDFIRLLITLSIIIAVLIFMTAGEITDTSESKIAVATLLIWAFSVVGWMNTGIITNTEINPLGQFSNQYGIAILSTGISVYFIFRRIFIRRI